MTIPVRWGKPWLALLCRDDLNLDLLQEWGGLGHPVLRPSPANHWRIVPNKLLSKIKIVIYFILLKSFVFLYLWIHLTVKHLNIFFPIFNFLAKSLENSLKSFYVVKISQLIIFWMFANSKVFFFISIFWQILSDMINFDKLY